MAFQVGTAINEQLAMQDISPLVKANALEQQAIVGLSDTVNKTVQGVMQKKMDKEDQEMRMTALAPLLAESGMAGERGTNEFNATLKSLAKNDDILANFKQLESVRAAKAELANELNIAKIEAGEGGSFGQAEGFEFAKEYFIPFASLSETDQENENYKAQGGKVVGGGQLQTSGGATQSGIAEGQRAYYDDKGNLHALPDGSQVFTTAGAEKRIQQVGEIETKLTETQRAIGTLEKYLEIRETGPQGLDLLYNQITGTMATMLGKTLTPDQIDAKTGGALFQQLLGQNRRDVLGPGVMTENDAKRLEKALGDFGAGSSFEVVRQAIGEILEGKKSSEKRLINRYNSTRRYPIVSDIYKTEYKSTSGNDFTDNDLEKALNEY